MNAIVPTDDQVNTYNDHLKHVEGKLALMVFRLKDDKDELEVTKTVEAEGFKYDEVLKELLPKDDACIFVVKFRFDTKDGAHLSKILAINYVSSEGCKPMRRFKNTTACKGLSSTLTGIQADIQAGDFSQMDSKTLIERFSK